MNVETIQCPNCAEPLDIAIDSSIPKQRYIEDSQVCCRPISINVSFDDDRQAVIDVQPES